MLGCRPVAGLTRRLGLGIRLFDAGAAPVLLLSGGGSGPQPEAETMRRMALARSVPEAAILVEPWSQDTVENAREAARLLHARGKRFVLLVSDRSLAARFPAVPSRRFAHRRLGRRAAAVFLVGGPDRSPRMCGVAAELGAAAPPPSSRWSLIGYLNSDDVL